jgi:hypothetical protein
MPVGIKDALDKEALLDKSSKGADREKGKTMKNCYEILVKAALVGVVLIASGCSLGNDESLVDNLKGLETAFGNAGSDHDGGMPGNGGNQPDTGGNVAATSGSSLAGGGGPGNSDFGRGTHANAGGGNGSETADGNDVSGDNPDLDPGNSGNSNGRSRDND